MTVMWKSHNSYNSHDSLRSHESHRSHTSHTKLCQGSYMQTLLWVIWQSCNRPYAIHHVTKHETDRWQKSGYYATFLSGEEDRGLWSVSTQEHFVSSLHHWCMQVSLITSMSISLVETLCIVGRNIKSLLVLVRKELANCSAILMLHWPLKMAT